jgi:lysophospholipase L1-like esterase
MMGMRRARSNGAAGLRAVAVVGVGAALGLSLGLGCSSTAAPGTAPGSLDAAAGGTGGTGGVGGAAGTDPGPIDAGFGGDAPPLTANVTLHVAGDSTAAIFPATDPTARVGWAAVLQPFFTAGVVVDDAARSGRSSKSFIDEGFWDALKAKIKPGDYVFIQFAHNDEKVGDVARYTDPATSFRDYLKVYIRDTRLAGGFAVLLTPIARRSFSGTMIVQTHGAYPAAIMAVAQETGTPVIDMTEKTTALLESLGPAATVPLFATGDDTHLSAVGAPQVAQLVVDGIRELQLPLVDRLAAVDGGS